MRYSKAIILNPPNPPGYVSNKDSMGGFGQLFGIGAPPAPSLDLPYLAAYLRSLDYPLDVVEAGADRLTTEAVCERISRTANARDALLVVRTSLPTIDWDLDVCASIRRHCEMAGIALIGPIVRPLLGRIKTERAIDYAVAGEPDYVVAELMRGDPARDIAGLVHREDGEWIENPERRFEVDLDRQPFPAWDLFPTEKYVIPRSSNVGWMRFLPMLTSRGCPYGCNYCPYPVGQGLRWRYRSAENVVDEIEWLVRDFKIDYIVFRDPMFSMKKNRTLDICREIQRRGIRVKWRCETRVDRLDDEMIEAMARAGCSGINFGVESTDPDIQEGVGRRAILPAEFRRMIDSCRRNGIETFAFYIVGLPGDNVGTIMDSIEFAVEARTGWTQFTVSTPFIGTKLHEFAVARGYIEPDFYRVVSSHEGSVGNGILTAAQIHGMHRFAQFLSNNLLNRRGILKNARRADAVYASARSLADLACYAAARILVKIGRWYFRLATRPVGENA